ncbi:SDR family oxidoreductase [Aeoliella mucimassa]|uniref:NAD dependent epimerase/dehydratase family protein n=1 Tax=Aeoliella mucimassa TaxID=2527972 RepID=A0A518AJ10_9BACT|nr:SDR family oxidoreductase [Aeoliella mucimassa]QDU54711.1 NAD dependent epimerase/dehydratase family protein [Aeoliella mucimassa]
MSRSALVVGCGYLGARVAERWHSQGWQVHAVTRSEKHADEFRSRGWVPTVADVTDPETLASLPEVDTLLVAVGYDRSGEQSIDEVYAIGMKNLLAAAPNATGRILYISTTGVYGDAAGDWIDESTPTAPQRAGGRASLAAEQLLRESRFAERSVVLRLAGIYGPERLPYLKQLASGEAIEAPQSGYLNLIHVADAASVAEWFGDPSRPLSGPELYCVCDGHPVVRRDYYGEAARLLNAPEPTFIAPAADSPRAARASSNRRVSNKKLVDTLPFGLSYPSYREGLQAIVRS